jgi:hypothetical protein
MDNYKTWPYRESLVIHGAGSRPMQTTEEHADTQRAYRRRIAASGEQEVLFRLSKETIALIDELKQRQGLRNRGQVLEQLIEVGRKAAQQ